MELVNSSDLVIGNKMSVCKGRWTWESAGRRSVVDYILFSSGLIMKSMQVEDSGDGDLGSDHNLVWCVVEYTDPKLVNNKCHYKWRVDGKVDWDEYQCEIGNEFMNWEECLESIKENSKGEECVEKVWEAWKGRVINAALKGIGRKTVGNQTKNWWSEEIDQAITERKAASRRFRRARKIGGVEGWVVRCWEEYRSKRRRVKVLIRKEKREQRKKTV